MVLEFKDAYASWKKKQVNNPNYDMSRFIDSVKRGYAPIESLLGHQTALYREVHYETLVLDTANQMKNIAEFIGEQWENTLASNDTTRAAQEFDAVRDVAGVESLTLASLKRPVFSDSISQWKKDLTPTEVEQIDIQLADYRRVLGFNTASDKE